MISKIVKGLSSLRDRTRGGPPPVVEAPHFETLEERVLLSLLGIAEEMGVPDMGYDILGTLDYAAAAQTYDAIAGPTKITFKAGPRVRPIPILPSTEDGHQFEVHILVNADGNVLGGDPNGPDLIVTGYIRASQYSPAYDGILLTAEIMAFGHLDTGTTTDQYDFRFMPTDGLLMPFFVGKEIGAVLNSMGSSFVGDFTVDFSGGAEGHLGTVPLLAPPPGSVLSGRVYVDANNDGVDDGNVAEPGIGGVQVSLSGTDIYGNAVEMATITNADDGTYEFTGLAPGTYTVTEYQPDDYLDGIDSAGTLGGTVGNDVVSEIVVVITGDQNGTGYNFGELEFGTLSGYVWEDFDDDGEIDSFDHAIEGATLILTGTDDIGSVYAETQTDGDGWYGFGDLRPGTYTITETQPLGYEDGKDTMGEGNIGGDDTVNDVFSAIDVNYGDAGMNYNFGERLVGSAVQQGQTATIGFWQNKNGQSLIKSVNNGENDTQLSTWLAETFPNMYGPGVNGVNPNDLTGMTNADVAAFYRNELFKAKKEKGTGPAKFDAQVMATVFAVYVTNSGLAGGTVATGYGFLVDDHGVGISTWNVGTSGAAFGVDDNTEMTIIDLLLATNDQAVNGALYNMDALLRELANDVYSAINEGGDIV